MLRPAQVVITASLSLIVSLYQQLPMPLLQLHNEAGFFFSIICEIVRAGQCLAGLVSL